MMLLLETRERQDGDKKETRQRLERERDSRDLITCLSEDFNEISQKLLYNCDAFTRDQQETSKRLARD